MIERRAFVSDSTELIDNLFVHHDMAFYDTQIILCIADDVQLSMYITDNFLYISV